MTPTPAPHVLQPTLHHRMGILSLSLLCTGLFVTATALPREANEEALNQLQSWIRDQGLPEHLASTAGLLYKFRLWLGLTTAFLAGMCDHWLGTQRIAELLRDRPGCFRFLFLTFQLTLVVWVCRRFHLEHEAFSGPFLSLVSIGFVVHFILPQPLRLHFLVLLSLIAILTILGWNDGFWLIAISALLIAIARSPIAFPYRVAGLLAAAAVMILARSGGVNTPWSDAIWPLVWSMFLFRMVIYTFDLRHEKAPNSWTHSLAYFYLLPNVVFPLFPPIDYNGLWRSYYQHDQFLGYQRGIHWMLVGVTHLLAYRYIDYFWIAAPETIITSHGLIQYTLASYLLIIRLSGQFHLIVGILHLFGFQLPRCMDNFFLATGFTDYWRRVNIYWKDFIQKVIYYPSFFSMRQFGNTTKIVVATGLGFLATWFFHSCQWYGLRGAWVLSSTDVFFWFSLAVLVLAGSLLENRYGRQRTLARKQASIGEILRHALKSTGVFGAMAILWSVWISPDISSWWNLVSRSKLCWVDVGVTLLAICGILATIVFIRDRWSHSPLARLGEFGGAILCTTIPLACLAALGSSLSGSLLGTSAESVLAELKTSRLSQKHDSMQFQGYYEQLNDINDFNFRLYELYSQRPQFNDLDVDQDAAGKARESRSLENDDVVGSQLVPNLDRIEWNQPFRTNQWGMRDRDYPLEASPSTQRIALMGGSISLGRGVAVEDNYESRLEATLNEVHSGNEIDKFEILNFSVGAHGVLQRLILLEQKALGFQPRIVLFTSHLEDMRPDLRHLGRTALNKIPYPEVVNLLESVGIEDSMPEQEIQARLTPIWNQLLERYFRRAVDICHQRGIRIALVVIPSRPEERAASKIDGLLSLAVRCGFDTTIDLSGAYDGYPADAIRVSKEDSHPNATGHRLLYERLYRELRGSSGVAIELFEAPSTDAVTDNEEARQ